jgi:predicted small metal-binding protein
MYTLKCEDLGTECPYIGFGDTEEDLITDVVVHAKEAHGLTEEQLNSPEFKNRIQAAMSDK